MRSLSVVFFVLSLGFVISCTHAAFNAHAVLNQSEIDPWLNTISGGKPPEIDITGKWHDAQSDSYFGWGKGYLRQEQNKISGAMNKYNVRGIVSGKIVYLVFLDNAWVHYTARLEMFQDLLTGNYFKADDREQTKGYPMSLEKTVEPPKQ